ncbi:MAG: chemotaxis protein CheW [Hyphomicrobiales bacterium]|nr:chemotaxis protein CheW [Hyphomicrobiales bacterium]
MDEILRDFLVETSEHIETAGTQLVALERDPSDHDMIASIFRLVHSIKGACGFLGLARLARLTHAAEALIGRLRDGEPASAAHITMILAAVDRVRELLNAIDEHGVEPPGDDDELIARLAKAGVAESQTAPAPAPQTPPIVNHLFEPHEAHAARRPETIRVTVEALETLMLLVSELVLTRNQLTEVTRANTDEAVKGALQRLSSVATDLQDAVMRARMQPMGRVLQTLPRLVRELAAELGKKIELVTEGEETELDRQLIELIRDPLTHMIRNCADHGLESTEERLARGKPDIGHIRVSAAHEAGQITIEVVDDGRGLDIAKIRDKALALGLTSQDEIAGMSEEETFRFIFAPGFSTAAKVTAISGRGVGLDVVRENIEAIGGSVSVTSTFGAGARFLIRIPLTLAIAPALIVTAGGQRFALPQPGVVEVVSIGLDSPHRLEGVQGAMVLRLRDDVLPVADLAAMLGLESAPVRADEERLVIVMKIGGASCGVIVHSVDDVQEIVVKPLAAPLRHIGVFSGQTILGDGAVVLILDGAGVAAQMGVQRTRDYRVAAPEPVVKSTSAARIVLLRAGKGAHKALPLSLITRIESVDPAQIETTGAGLVIRHNGQLMPLLPAARDVTMAQESQPVLIVGVGGETLGLIVDEIVDIVEAPLDVQIAQVEEGVLGSAEFGGVVAELLDLTHYMRIARPESVKRGVNRRYRILLVDDRAFFRDMLSPVLSAAGYSVTARASAAEALDAIERSGPFDALVTDTDMPDMDGYALARQVRAKTRSADMPIIALAAQTAPKIVEAAQACGMDEVAGKFDRKGLLETLARRLRPNAETAHVEERALAENAA